MSRLRIGHSYWLDVFAGRALSLPALTGRHRADIAIVGGGVTGCAAALLFARAGARVVLVEARRIGRGSTAASTALLMQVPDVDFHELAERYGPAAAGRVWACSRAAVVAMRRTLADLRGRRHGLPSLYYARDPGDARTLRREVALRRRAGARCRSLDGDAVAPCRVSPRQAGSSRRATPRSIHTGPAWRSRGRPRGRRGPLRAIAGRADRSHPRRRDPAAGARVDRRGPGRGRHGIRHRVVQAARRAFEMMNTYVIATPRLDAAERRGSGSRDVMLWDTDRPYHYLRWTPDRRLLFGGQRSSARAARHPSGRARAARARADGGSVALYPSLEGRARTTRGRGCSRRPRTACVYRSTPPLSEASLCARLRRQQA